MREASKRSGEHTPTIKPLWFIFGVFYISGYASACIAWWVSG